MNMLTAWFTGGDATATGRGQESECECVLTVCVLYGDGGDATAT